MSLTPEGAGIVLRMYEGALWSVAARAAYARQCVEAAGLDYEAWRELPAAESYPWPEGTREHAIARGKKILRQRGNLRGRGHLPLTCAKPGAIPETGGGAYGVTQSSC